MEKAYMVYYIENYEPYEEIFSTPEKALQHMSQMDGTRYILNKDKAAIYDLNTQLFYIIMEKEIDPKPTIYFGPQRSNGDIPVHFESEHARMIEVRKGS